MRIIVARRQANCPCRGRESTATAEVQTEQSEQGAVAHVAASMPVRHEQLRPPAWENLIGGGGRMSGTDRPFPMGRGDGQFAVLKGLDSPAMNRHREAGYL